MRLWDLHIPREKWLNYLQTVETLIRRRILRHLIWVCTVCQVPFYGYPDHNGLRGRDTLSKGVAPPSWNGPCSCDWGSWFAIYNEVGQTEWEIAYHAWSKSATLCKVCLWCLFVCLFYSGFTSLSTIFSHHDGIWTWQGAQCSLLECCLTEISCPRCMTWHSPGQIILTPGWRVLSPLSQCWMPSKRAASTIFKVFGMTLSGFEPTTSRSKSGCSSTWVQVCWFACDVICCYITGPQLVI